MKLTIDKYSKEFKMSKEMINSKLKAKKLNYVIEDGVTYIVVNQPDLADNIKPIIKEKKPITMKPKTTVGTVISLYQRENAQLKEKIMRLENKIDKLIDDKEQMLRDERDKIEELYSKKDEQLKNILELVNTKLMLEHQTVHDVETLHKDEPTLGVVELKEYLKTLDIKSYQKKVIKRRFYAVYDTDMRITQKNSKLYLDLSKHDYSDLLS